MSTDSYRRLFRFVHPWPSKRWNPLVINGVTTLSIQCVNRNPCQDEAPRQQENLQSISFTADDFFRWSLGCRMIYIKWRRLWIESVPVKKVVSELRIDYVKIKKQNLFDTVITFFKIDFLFHWSFDFVYFNDFLHISHNNLKRIVRARLLWTVRHS